MTVYMSFIHSFNINVITTTFYTDGRKYSFLNSLGTIAVTSKASPGETLSCKTHLILPTPFPPLWRAPLQ